MNKKGNVIENIKNINTFERIIGWVLDFVFLLLLLFFHKFLNFDTIKNEYLLILPLISFLLRALRCLFSWMTCFEDEMLFVSIQWWNGVEKLRTLLFIYYIDSFYNKKTCYLLIPSCICILYIASQSYLNFDRVSELGFEGWINLFICFFMNISFVLSIIFRIGTIYPFHSIFIFLMCLWALIPVSNGIINSLKSPDKRLEYRLRVSETSLATIMSIVLHVLFLLKLEDIIHDSFWWIVVIIGTLFILFNDQILTYILDLRKFFQFID
jgi:hypothetical protein